MAINFNQSPYYDDFDATKNFYRFLFRPNYAVQARELTQIQTLLQNQIAVFGRHIFKDGSPVQGGQTTLEVSGVYALNVDSTFNTTAIDAAAFKGKFITSGNVRAFVAATVEATNTAGPALIIKYVTGEEFDNTTFGQTITTDTGNVQANVSLSSPISNTSICSINEGFFFVNNLFAHCAEQTIVLDARANTPSYRIGLQIDETIITEAQDGSLRDPALASTNYQAPGATRFNLELTLAKRTLASQDDSLFLELLRVANGVLQQAITYPQLSDLERTLARRTNDQSGSFTVKQFRVALGNDANYANAYSILLEPGKAYVQGFEYETISTTSIKSERARDVANVRSYPLSMEFKNYIYVANVRGPLYTKTLEPLTIHCVANASINTLTTTTAQSTAIGTLRVRSVEHEDSTNTGIHTLYAFDVNVGSRTAVSQAGGTSNTIILDLAAASQNNAYQGMRLRLGSTATQNLESVIIASYNGINKTATLETNKTFTTNTVIARTFTLDYEFADAESFVVGNTNAIWSNSDVYAPFSKYPTKSDVYNSAFFYETNLNRSLFPLPNEWIGNNSIVGGLTMSTTSYQGRQTTTQTAVANVISFTTVSGIKSTVVGSPLSVSDAFKNIRVVMTTQSGGTIGNNSLIIWDGSNTVTVTSTATDSTYTITIPNAGASIFDVDIKVNFPTADTTTGIRKSKTYKTANPNFFDSATPLTTVATGTGFRSQNSNTGGVQLHFLTGGNTSSAVTQKLRTPNLPQSIYTADVIMLKKVADFGLFSVTNSNIANSIDITSSYTLDNGQRDNSYDHATIRLKSGGRPPRGNVVVWADYYSHTGTGYLTVDSYPSSNVEYANIPTYTSPTTGEVFNLRDCIDFRARRLDADNLGAFQETYFPTSGSIWTSDFSYYLPRIDKVILTKDREFIVRKGISSITPTPPADSPEGMTLYTLALPAYTSNTSGIGIRYSDHRRYTMKDIGVLEQRIQNLEYYTSLNLLEKAAQATEIQDNVGLTRPKNGIIVDSFTGHSVGDVLNPDYACSIDVENRELRPPFVPRSYPLDFRTSSSSNYQQRGSSVTLPYTEVALVDQFSISKAVNVNPFNTVTFIGKVQLDPSSDTWVDTKQKPDVLVNAEGDNDAWQALSEVVNNDASNRFGTTWNSWQTNWTGVTQRTEATQSLQDTGRRTKSGRFAAVQPLTTTRFVNDVTTKQVRTGVTTSFAPETITRSLGNRVVDVSVVPYIRPGGILFTCSGFRPNTRVYMTFDGVNVDRFINLSNIIKIANATIQYRDGYQHGEEVRVWDPANSRYTANATVVFSRNEAGYSNITVVNVESANDNVYATEVYVSGGSRFLRGNTSGANSQITGYYHRSGSVWLANANSIFIGHDALGSTNFGPSYANLTNQTITITSGPGAGHSVKFSHYNPTTGVVSLGSNQFGTGTSYTLPTTASTYTIGTSFTNTPSVGNVSMFITDWRGEGAGVFSIPDVTSLASVLQTGGFNYKFRTGDRKFVISDSPTGELSQSYTNGEGTYTAQGFLETKENSILSTRQPGINRQILTDNKTVVSSVVTREDTKKSGSAFWMYIDPLAQTFTVDARNHPVGVMSTGVRLIFRSKDTSIPVRVQLRPVVNGYPDSSLVLPHADIIVPSDKVRTATEAQIGARYANTSFTNPLTDSNLYTEIQWDAPVYLAPGTEYSICIIANSQKYELYVSEVGKQLLGTNRLISQQPYLGSLFKSQNSSTWEPIQLEDLCFQLLTAQYNTSVTANVELGISLKTHKKIVSNVPIDAFYISSSIFQPANTSLESVFLTTPASTGVIETARTLQFDENMFFGDTTGRRIVTINPDSFKVRVFFSSSNKDVSPVIDKDRISLLAIENVINNLGLVNTSFVVTDSNTNFSPSNVSITITPNANSLTTPTITANAFANVIANVLSSLTVDISGAGYTLTPTVIVTGGGPTASANVVCHGEDQASGGPALARYITRKVTLADGMDAGDFRVYFTAYRPTNANIYVYSKVLSGDDVGAFDDKGYQLMTAIAGYSQFSLEQSDFKEFVFAPGDDNLASDLVQYEGFQSFKHFAIKIVMTSTDTTKVPRIRDFRVVAVPAIPSNG